MISSESNDYMCPETMNNNIDYSNHFQDCKTSFLMNNFKLFTLQLKLMIMISVNKMKEIQRLMIYKTQVIMNKDNYHQYLNKCRKSHHRNKIIPL